MSPKASRQAGARGIPHKREQAPHQPWEVGEDNQKEAQTQQPIQGFR